jgi:hypothetical protein
VHAPEMSPAVWICCILHDPLELSTSERVWK